MTLLRRAPFGLALLAALATTPPAAAHRRSPPPNRFAADATLLTIAQRQDERAVAPLLAFFTVAAPGHRAAAAAACGAVRAPETREPLQRLLTTDPTPAVRRAAAWALGLLADTLAQPALLTAARTETDPAARAAVLESLGRVATAGGGGLRYLTDERLPAPAATQARAGWAWGLYRAATRGVINDAAVARAVALLAPPLPVAARLAAAHLLARTPKLDLTEFETPLLNAARADSSVEVRIAATQALGKVRTDVAADAIVSLLQAAPDPRVRIAALRAAARLRYEQVKEAAWEALEDADPNVRITAADFFLTNAPADEGATGGADLFRKRAGRQTNFQVQATLLAVALKVAHTPAEAVAVQQDIETRYAQAPDDYRRAALLRALGQRFANHPFIATETFRQPLRPVVAAAGLETLTALQLRPDFPAAELTPVFAGYYRRALESGDVGLMSAAAATLREPALHLPENATEIAALRTARQKLTLPRDIETAQELDRTLAFLTKQPAPALALPPPQPTDWGRVRKIRTGQRVEVETERGVIELELLVDAAPASVATFVRLVKAKFYDGLAFHRVVPNFVAQGGDPRGDGSGSLDYTLRTELHPDLGFGTGAVGLASSGFDTESCQWFVMHTPAPHLDGRYTVFARLTRGQDVVQQLRVGDRMKKVRLR